MTISFSRPDTTAVTVPPAGVVPTAMPASGAASTAATARARVCAVLSRLLAVAWVKARMTAAAPVQPAWRAVPTASAASRRAAGRGRVPAAQPDRADHRRRQRGADHCGRHIQAPQQQRLALHLRGPEPGALLLAPVHPLLRGVDIDPGHGLPAGQQRRFPGKGGQQPPVHRA
jgi:hypothetical protein